ncbi:urease accessory protein UreD [Actinomycetospora endophytica]|uniref:Urease accessory protein UreD n=1 Tax=Actinomycetospora endophytica TaxID=2291215 RepID=A0ABS8PBA4_9PSEU|nr:urease accessory protein UreD [Actinomycetospora endophytica]MCD2195541.1 urease accessory protein UreD [Actinomycetospora endophytica]
MTPVVGGPAAGRSAAESSPAVDTTAGSAVGGGAVEATARLRLVDGRLTWASAPPIVLRRTGHRRVHLVAVGGGPLGGDRLRLEVELGPGERLSLHSAAATVVQPGRDPGRTASMAVTASLATGSALDWRPEPTVVCDAAAWEPSVRLDLADGARARVVEQLVLGRSGQVGGRCASTMRAAVGGTPILATTTVLDGADAALIGLGGTGGARSVGSVLVVGTDSDRCDEDAGEDGEVTWARSPLAGPGALTTAVGSTRAVAALLAREGGAQPPWW